MNHGLLENLAREARTVYLSDLRMPRYRKKLVRLLTGVRAEDYDFTEWRDAVTYLTGKPAVDVKAAADVKGFLIEKLKEELRE